MIVSRLSHLSKKGNKKAQESSTTLFYLLFGLMLAAFFVFGVFFKVKDAVGDTSYYKRFYARDLALLIDSMHAANGYLAVGYEMNHPGDKLLDISLEPGRVFLTDRLDIALQNRPKTSFRFGFNTFVEVNPETMNKTITYFALVFKNSTVMFEYPKEDVSLPQP